MATLEQLRQQMAQNRAAFAAKAAELWADTRWTADAKRKSLTEEYRAAMQRHNGLKRATASAADAERSQRMTRAFRAPGTGPLFASAAEAADFRDAMRDAEATTDGKAMEKLLDRALATSDRGLLRACAAVSYSRGWRPVVAAVSEHDAGVSELYAFLTGPDGEWASLTERFGRAATMTAPERPQEVAQNAANTIR